MTEETKTTDTLTDPSQISSMLDKAFDQGVDRCIELAKIGLDHSDIIEDSHTGRLLRYLISRFESLKTKKQ